MCKDIDVDYSKHIDIGYSNDNDVEYYCVRTVTLGTVVTMM